ncbi:MAG: HAMP domain-containing protein [Bacteroidales bacterium]|nr:HAMP domain-containing protein [Bacteroidales bacterium]MBN2756957.1 HAMP domain-containing protein [Bacteroidales bacterium]
MKYFYNLSIKTKISLIIISISLFAVIFSFFVISINNVQTFKNDLVLQNSLTAKLISEYLIYAIAFDDTKDAVETLDKLNTQPFVLKAELYDSKGKFFASYKNKKASRKNLIYKNSSFNFSGDKLHIYESIHADGEFFGTLHLLITTEYLNQKVKDYFFLMLIIIFVMSLFVVFLANSFQNIITKPILKLASLTQEISKTNDYTIRINKFFDDEIGILYEGFNEMLEQIVKNETNTRKAQTALIKSEEQFSIFMQMLPAGAFIKNADYTYKYVNKFLIDEFDAHYWVDKNITSNLPSERKQLKNEGDIEALENVFHLEDSLYDNKNELRFLETWKFPIKRHKTETLIGGFTIDVTKRKNAEQKVKYYIKELERNNSDLEEFNYVASHDLREPLRTITSYCDLLKEDLGDELNKDSSEDINFITDAAARMNTLIQDILQLSRAGRVEFEQEAVDLNVIMSNIVKDLKLKIEENLAEVKYSNLPIVKGDAVQLSRVFQNLLTNSLKFKSEKKPIIEITTKLNDDFYILNFSDNGIGIEKQYHMQIFSAFKRLHSREEYEGTGIGLAICKKIIERHNGSISLESEKNIGTKFIIKLNKY